MSLSDIARRRVRNLGLTGRPFDTAEDVVRWLTAVQSQDHAPARWSIGQRMKDGRDAVIEQAIATGAIIRTHVLRPTWHYVLAEDLRWLLALTGPRVTRTMAYYNRLHGLDQQVRARCNDLLARALEGGQHRTRTELAAALARGGIEAKGSRLGHIMGNAELDGVICSGVARGKQQTYALLEERVPPARPREPDEALAELVLRYFTSHGPATVNDLKWWASLSVADIRRGIEMLGRQLVREEVEGMTFYSAGARPGRSPPSPHALLLQGYDEYAVGYTESKYVLALVPTSGPWADRGAQSYQHLLVIDTQLLGRWRRTIGKDGVLIELVPYHPLDRAQSRAAHAAADRHGDYLGLPAELVIVDVSSRSGRVPPSTSARTSRSAQRRT